VSQHGGATVMRSDPEIAAVAVEVSGRERDELAVPEIAIRRLLRIVSHLGLEGRGSPEEQRQHERLTHAISSDRSSPAAGPGLTSTGWLAPRRRARRPNGAGPRPRPPSRAEPDWWCARCEGRRWPDRP